MNHTRVAEAPQAPATNPSYVFSTGPSLQCAALFFVASVSSFVGASLLLASI